MKEICFFNHHHNGDLISSKSFIVEIMSNINTKYYYRHYMNEKVLSDLNLEYVGYPTHFMSDKIIEDENIVYVNTWIGSYFEHDEFRDDLSLLGIYNMFGKVYNSLNQIFNTSLKLSDPINYFPKVDYSKFDLFNIHSYLQQDPKIKILFCNGKTLSGQCTYTGDMKEIIEKEAQKHPDKTFITTKNIDSNIDNIKFTGDIIDSINKCDLNEISYLSTFCNLIIGRNSGPHCFTIVDDNLKNKEKTFYSFSSYDKKICLPRDLDVKCNFIFDQYTNYQSLEKTISELIAEL
jgi:hypothetical protein